MPSPIEHTLPVNPSQFVRCFLADTNFIIYHPLGKPVWTFDSSHFPNGILAAPAVVIPDVDGDRVSDLMVLTIGKTQVGCISQTWGRKEEDLKTLFPYSFLPAFSNRVSKIFRE